MSRHALRSSACPACGNTTVTLVREVNGYRLARCQTCGLVHVNPTPGDAEIEAHYQDPRYFSGNEGQGYLHYEDTEKALLPHFNRRQDLIESHLHHRGK